MRLLAVVVALVVLAVPARAVTIDAGVILRPPSSNTDFSFVEAQSFGSVEVRASSLVLDTYTVELGKSPAAGGNAVAEISTWAPSAGEPRLAWTWTSTAGSTAWFNFTGLRSGHYIVRVDGNGVFTADAGPTVTLFIEHREWSRPHAFVVELARGGGELPTGPTAQEEIVLGLVCGVGVFVVLFIVLLAPRRRRRDED